MNLGETRTFVFEPVDLEPAPAEAGVQPLVTEPEPEPDPEQDREVVPALTR